MAKDPAFLFYYQDFLVGTTFMSNEQVGAYIKILCYQADKGSIPEEHMLSICINKKVLDSILSKFVIDKEGNYYNVRLRDEMEKRKNYAESRRKNARSHKAYAEHMEDEDVNINEDISNNRLDDELETARMLWISIFTNNPGSVEKEFVAERIKFGGLPYAKKLFRDFREMGFHKVRTMKEALDENGNIKPKSQSETRKEITYDEFCKLPIDEQKKYKKNKDKNIWELINV